MGWKTIHIEILQFLSDEKFANWNGHELLDYYNPCNDTLLCIFLEYTVKTCLTFTPENLAIARQAAK